ncbi:hypothetical protein TWF696_001724 [Orbilia brochopaga]|uniref:Uncharacterized protein n=1 Tax=Orbilia brochopaga TaxID=3140254 RepID=A0AAV9U788_9PEZI
MKNFRVFLFALAVARVYGQPLTFPNFLYRINYNEPIIQAYDDNGDPLIDFEGNPVFQDFLIGEAKLYGGGSCISPEPGANAIQIYQLPEGVIFPVETYGWLMYPGSAACNADKGPEDPKQELALSLNQARYGWRQTYGQAFPWPVSFRLFQEELTRLGGPGSGTTLDFSAVGSNLNIPSQPPELEIDDLSFAQPQFEIDPDSDIAREYARRDWRIYIPEGRIDRLVPPLRGDENPRPYPNLYYPVYTPDTVKPPASQLFRSFNVINRLAEDLVTGEIELSALNPVDLANFAGAFMGPPITSTQPRRYNWPDEALIAQLGRLEGFQVPVDNSNPQNPVVGYYSPNGHTLEEALAIAPVFVEAIRAWLETQDYSVMTNLGIETPAQRAAERWLYQQEDLWRSPVESVSDLDKLDVAREIDREDIGDLAAADVEAIQQQGRVQEALINAESFEEEVQPLSQLGVSVGGGQGQLERDQNQLLDLSQEVERPATDQVTTDQVTERIDMLQSQQQPGTGLDNTAIEQLNVQSMQDPDLSRDLGQPTNLLYQSYNPNAGMGMNFGFNQNNAQAGQNNAPLGEFTGLPWDPVYSQYWAARRGRALNDLSLGLSRGNSRTSNLGDRRTNRARSRSPGPG